MIKPIERYEMDLQKIKKLGNAGLHTKVRPIRKLRYFEGEIVGFDTEYTSKKNHLISFQLWSKNDHSVTEVHTGEILTPEWIYEESCKLLGYAPYHILFPVYFSAAELQFLPVAEQGFNRTEYSPGFMDCDFNIENGKAVITIFDLARFFPKQSLEKAAKAFGLKKISYNTKKITRKNLNDPVFIKYSQHDAFLVYEIATQLHKSFQEKTGIDIFIVKTPAKASADAFRNMHVTEPLMCDRDDVRKLVMRSCWGGRAEVFFRGKVKGITREDDLKGAYSTAAISLKEFPIQGSWKDVKSLIPINRNKYKGGFAKIKFQFPDIQFPCLPVRHKNFMLYPLEGVSYCTFDEIKYAYELGCKIKIIEAYGYKKGYNGVQVFMETLQEERKTAKEAESVRVKLMANSIIGKFAQCVSKFPIEEFARIALEENFCLDELMSLPKKYLHALGLKSHVSVGSVFMPEWNGLITGRVRTELAFMLNNSESPVYCHTDSVWSIKKPPCIWIENEIKAKGKATIIRTRLAGLTGEIKQKSGTWKKGAHIARHSIWSLKICKELLKSFNGEDIIKKYTVNRPLRFREALKAKKPVGFWRSEVRTASTIWDNKRALFSDGFTRPWKNTEEYDLYYKPKKRSIPD